jgi:hypothetical protein
MSTLQRIAPLLPQSIAGAQRALERLERDIVNAKNSDELLGVIRTAKAIREYYVKVEAVRHQAERTVLLAQHRLGEEIAKAPKARGTRGQLRGRGVIGPAPEAGPIATVAERAGGSAKRGALLRQLGEIPPEILNTTMDEIHAKRGNVNLGSVLKSVRAELTAIDREDARNAMVIPDGMDYRLGDCRKVLTDIKPNSVALVLTDPPWHKPADPLYEWLAQFAARVLIPGGALVCYTGQARLDRDFAIFGRHLRYWWMCNVEHTTPYKKLRGKFVLCGWRSVLWYVKQKHRGLRSTSMPDVWHSRRDKSLHPWAQGDGADIPIEHLTAPGELIVDPFAGSGNWGRTAVEMGRRWIGSDVVRGGDTVIVADSDGLAKAAE